LIASLAAFMAITAPAPTATHAEGGEGQYDCSTSELTALVITMIVVALVFMMTTVILLQHTIRQEHSREDFPEVIVSPVGRHDGFTET
jgi:hypothetical protein